MNKIWYIMVLSSLVVLCVINPEGCINSMITAGGNAVTLSIKLAGVYAIWLGIIKLVELSKLSDKIAWLLSPVIDWLFGKTDPQTKSYLALNMSTNMLGMGNACTPMGIKAMENLDRINNYQKRASTAMIMLLVINATSIQILPTTIMGLRVTYGSTTSSDIIIPTLIATAISTLVGVILVKVLGKISTQRGSK